MGEKGKKKEEEGVEDKKGENLLLKWDELKNRKKEVLLKSTLQNDAKKLEITPNLKECNRDIKKEQVVQKEDSCFTCNWDQNMETGENLLMRWDELKNRSNNVPPQSSLQNDAKKLEITPNLKECNRDIKKEQVLQKEDSFLTGNQYQKLEMVENLLMRWDKLKNRSNDVPPQSSLQKDAMKLEMTQNMEEEMLQKEAEKVLERAVPKIHTRKCMHKKKRKERNRGEAYKELANNSLYVGFGEDTSTDESERYYVGIHKSGVKMYIVKPEKDQSKKVCCYNLSPFCKLTILFVTFE